LGNGDSGILVFGASVAVLGGASHEDADGLFGGEGGCCASCAIHEFAEGEWDNMRGFWERVREAEIEVSSWPLWKRRAADRVFLREGRGRIQELEGVLSRIEGELSRLEEWAAKEREDICNNPSASGAICWAKADGVDRACSVVRMAIEGSLEET